MRVTLPTRGELSDLVELAPAPSVSIYMPTHKTGRETRQDPIRLKNLLNQAHDQLASFGCDQAECDAVLRPARELPDDVTASFWRNGSDGLVLLLRQDRAACYKLPVNLPEVALAANRFYLLPLLRYLQGDGHYYVLAVSQNRVRLLSGTKQSLTELQLESLPTDLADALNIDEYETSLQYHSHTTVQGTAAAGGEAIFHGHGGGEGEDRKEEILRYFQHLSRALTAFLQDDDAPLVFAGVEYLLPIFRQTCDYPHLLSQPLAGNPDDRSADELHGPSWKIVEPKFLAARDDAIDQYGVATGRQQASDELPEIITAAGQGRVDTLLLLDRLTGEYRPTDNVPGELEGVEGAPRGKLDAFSLAAARTLQTGGKVYLVDPDEMPTDSEIAAVYRY